MKIFNVLKKLYSLFFLFVHKLCNRVVKKNRKAILFYPHINCLYDGYDVLNGDSSNVLCLLNNMLRDPRFDDYDFFILYYHKDRLESYLKYALNFNPQRIHFIFYKNNTSIRNAVFKCFTIFTDCDYQYLLYKTSSQRVVCLDYYPGLFKGEFFRWEGPRGFWKMLVCQYMKYICFDYNLSVSDIWSKLKAVDVCHYYPHYISLGFPRNDIFFKDNTELLMKIKKYVGFNVKKIITYVPTHRDYENAHRSFYDSSKTKNRSIWGHETQEDIYEFEKILNNSDTLIIAKVHPIQFIQTSVISDKTTSHVVLFSDLVKNVQTSLNPLLAISDCIITDYTSAVFDYLYINRPIIYYFYDIEEYRATRGFFIEPIESICAGHLTYNLKDLGCAVKDVICGNDPWREKRVFLQNLFIKHLDGNASDRIKKFFFSQETDKSI